MKGRKERMLIFHSPNTLNREEWEGWTKEEGGEARSKCCQRAGFTVTISLTRSELWPRRSQAFWKDSDARKLRKRGMLHTIESPRYLGGSLPRNKKSGGVLCVWFSVVVDSILWRLVYCEPRSYGDRGRVFGSLCLSLAERFMLWCSVVVVVVVCGGLEHISAKCGREHDLSEPRSHEVSERLVVLLLLLFGRASACK